MSRHDPEIREGRGRSAQKRAAKAVEELARQLVDLPESALADLPLSAALCHELEAARTTRGHSSRRRQLKHFAGCLRRDDEMREQAKAWLETRQTEQAGRQRDFHRWVALRDRLCDPACSAQALEEIRALLPAAEVEKIAGLARAVHAGGDKKAAREIFRRLRDAAVLSPPAGTDRD